MIVKSGDLEPVVQGGAHDRADLIFRHDHIAHHHVILAVALERGPGGEAHRWRHFHARDDHGEIFAGNRYLEHTFLLIECALSAGQALDGGGIHRAFRALRD